jgi:hypothetical protein
MTDKDIELLRRAGEMAISPRRECGAPATTDYNQIASLVKRGTERLLSQSHQGNSGVTKSEIVWRARCEAMRAVSCVLSNTDFDDLDIDRDPASQIAHGDTEPVVNVSLLRENWNAIDALTGILADKRKMAASEARAIIAGARRSTDGPERQMA